MKRGLALFLCAGAALTLAACAAASAPASTAAVYEAPAAQETAAPEPEAAETAAAPAQAAGSKILIAYFSRYGNTVYPDAVDASTSASIVLDAEPFGTTEYVARMIRQATGGDLHPIRTQEPYPSDFDVLRELNHREAAEGYLPPLAESELDLSQYDTVLLGYPVWASNVPQAVLSFLNEYDLSGKTVIPFCTHDGYGAGRSYSTVREASHAAGSPEGLAIEAGDVTSAASAVASWLEALGLSAGSAEAETAGAALTITVGDTVLEGVLYDTALAQEIRAYFPLTVSMSRYGGREYYGGVDFYPAEEHLTGGQNTFANGDITYCEAHRNMAIFYAQTDDPVLSVDVIPIGKVTSDLSILQSLGGRETVTFSLAE